MRKIAFACGTLLIVWMAGASARAQRPTGPVMPNNARFGNPDAYARKYQDYLYGVIAKISPTAIVLNKTKFGVPKTVELTRKTKYIVNGRRSSIKSLKHGEMVFVQVKKVRKTGGLLAKRVVSGMAMFGGG